MKEVSSNLGRSRQTVRQIVNCLLLFTAVLTAVQRGFGDCPVTTNAVTFLGVDTTTQGAWKGAGNFNAPPASSSLTYGRDGDILPDTEGCDLACNPVPNYASFGPQCINSATPGNTGSKPNTTHSYVNLVQGPASVMGAEPQNTTNTNFFQCNYTDNNPAVPWAPMVAWRPVVDTREISRWYTCGGISSFYLELSFGSSTHNFEVYVVDDMNGGTLARTEEIQVLDGNTNAVLWDSGAFTNFSGGMYYKWAITGHVKIKVINLATNGRDGIINGVFFDPLNAAPLPVSVSVSPANSSVAAGLSEHLTAIVSNTTNTAVTWSLSANVGSISTAGVYTAPTNITTVQTVTVTATSVADTTKSASATLTLLPPVPGVTGGPLVANFVLGTLRNNYTGWVGFGFTVGASPVTITGLGRIAVSGNSQSHTVKLVDASTGVDVSGAAVFVMPGSAPAGTFAYAALSSPVTLAASKSYYVVTQETSGGDQWYDTNTSMQTTADATETGSIYGAGFWASGGPAGHSYGPVDVKYTLGAGAPAPPPPPVSGTALVTSMFLGTPRNNYSGWVGTVVKVGAAPMVVSGLGRIAVAGNTQSHTVKLVDATSGLDVPNGSVSITPANASPGAMAYAALATPVTLNPSQTYFVVTQETYGGDQWYDFNTALQTTADASLTAAVYGGPAWTQIGTSGHSYGPVDVKYTLGATSAPPSVSVSPLSVNLTAGQMQQFAATVGNTSNTGVVWTMNPSLGLLSTTGFYTAPASITTAQTVVITATSVADSSQFATASVNLTPAPATSGTTFMTGVTLGTLRNNYTGWIGYEFTVKATPLVVSALGRISVSGNSQNHLVKLVDAATGADIPNGSVTITPSSANPGTLAYASLAGPITLSPWKSYYVVTQETSGGDQWYDTNTTLQTTADATISGSVYGVGTWNTGLLGMYAYGPVDFKYTLSAPPPPPVNISFVTSAALGTIRNNYSGWVGFGFQVGASPITVSAVGRYVVSGNSQTHTVKLVDASTGADVPNGSATVVTSGAIPGAITYVPLSSPVVLTAGHSYYLLTQETSGGDQWYDTNTALQTTGAATVTGSMYGTGTWLVGFPGNRTYGPVDFKY